MAIYEKSVRFLMKDMVTDIDLKKGERISKHQVIQWFARKYPKIKESTIIAHLVRMSTNATSRHHYNPKPVEDDLFFHIDGSSFRLFDNENDPTPLKKGIAPPDEIGIEESTEPDDKNEFAYENDLQNFLSKNLGLIEPGLSLYEEEGINGIEFPVGGRYIDILALDKNNNYVVIELKVSRGYDRVVGQILRYISWIKKHQAENSQNVRGIIIAREISDDLTLACDGLSNIELFEYQLSITLQKVQEKI